MLDFSERDSSMEKVFPKSILAVDRNADTQAALGFCTFQ
jgi:hypothetical protein